MKTGLTGSLGRLSSRERTMVLSLIGVLVFLLIAGTAWTVGSTLADKEAKIAKNSKTWVKIQKHAGAYLQQIQARKALNERIKSNPDARSPDSPVQQASLQTQVHFRSGSSSDDETGPLNKIMHSTGEATKRLIGKRRKGDEPQFFRVEKQFNMKRDYVKVNDFWKFLESVEAMKNMVYITRLHLVRWSRDADYVQVRNLTATTVSYQENSGEED